jgi:hypothetical protein
LKGTDGVLVPAVRVVLAIRSKVFRRMLYGDFVEAKKFVVELGYSGEVLRAIVEYICSDTCGILETETFNEEFVQTIVSLVDAATYFELPKLCEKAQEAARRAMEKKPSLSGTFLVAYDTQGSIAPSALVKTASKNIQANPKLLLEEGSKLARLSSARIEEILKDNTLFTDEYTVFLILQAWSNATGAPSSAGLLAEDSSTNSRKRTATQFMEHIALDCISPSVLCTNVAESGLVTNEQLNAAYKTQALTTEDPKTIRSYKKRRLVSVWERSSDAVLDAFTDGSPIGCIDRMQIPLLKEGIHKWSILVEELNRAKLNFGVKSPTTRMSFLYSWAGRAWTAIDGEPAKLGATMIISRDHPTFGTDSKVTFTLDLTGDEGTLSASVDGYPPALLFSNLFSQIGEGEGVVPVVVLGGPARVRFLGFE